MNRQLFNHGCKNVACGYVCTMCLADPSVNNTDALVALHGANASNAVAHMKTTHVSLLPDTPSSATSARRRTAIRRHRA